MSGLFFVPTDGIFMPFLTAILFPYISSNSLILSKSGFQSAPISRKRPCATLYVLSVPRHPFRAWNMPRPGRIVGRPDALGLVPVRLKVSMDRAFFDVLRHWCTCTPLQGESIKRGEPVPDVKAKPWASICKTLATAARYRNKQPGHPIGCRCRPLFIYAYNIIIR